MSEPETPADGTLVLAQMVGTLIGVVRKQHIRMVAQALIIQKHLKVDRSEWARAVKRAQKSFPPFPEDVEFETIRAFLQKL